MFQHVSSSNSRKGPLRVGAYGSKRGPIQVHSGPIHPIPRRRTTASFDVRIGPSIRGDSSWFCLSNSEIWPIRADPTRRAIRDQWPKTLIGEEFTGGTGLQWPKNTCPNTEFLQGHQGHELVHSQVITCHSWLNFGAIYETFPGFRPCLRVSGLNQIWGLFHIPHSH